MIQIKYLERANQTSRLTNKWSSYFLRHSGERIDRQTWNQIFLRCVAADVTWCDHMINHRQGLFHVWSAHNDAGGTLYNTRRSGDHFYRWQKIFYQDCWGAGLKLNIEIEWGGGCLVEDCNAVYNWYCFQLLYNPGGKYAMQLCASQCQFEALKQFKSPLQLFQLGAPELMFNLKFKSPAGLCWLMLGGGW